ncbi:hypothetical protein [Vandammella animalimorsus]|uniref:hypothetical protein n=1 Tax=Vandammella animalimorsus TaxID=2029117 RepID=UPI001551C08C|nr:hypothetical protein [Vandammella animalimorsus]
MPAFAGMTKATCEMAMPVSAQGLGFAGVRAEHALELLRFGIAAVFSIKTAQLPR